MNRKRIAILLLVVVLLAALLMSASAVAFARDPMNILLIGTDAREKDAQGRSDTMILVRLDPQKGEVRMVSFLRSLYVPIPGYGKTRLNAAFRYGEEPLLKETLLQNFGVSVDRTVTVDFSQLIDFVDDLGGIELEITQKERAEINKMVYGFGGTALASSEGPQTLDGAQALCYSRIRRIDNDAQRTSRQQAVIRAMLKKAGTRGILDLMGLAAKHMGKVRTDVALTDLLSFVPMIGKLNRLEIHTFQMPQSGSYEGRVIDGESVKVPKARSIEELHAFLNGE